jgi:hypothetical protein
LAKRNVSGVNTSSACNALAFMELQKDFEDLCASLNGRAVRYLIVGGYALPSQALLPLLSAPLGVR